MRRTESQLDKSSLEKILPGISSAPQFLANTTEQGAISRLIATEVGARYYYVNNQQNPHRLFVSYSGEQMCKEGSHSYLHTETFTIEELIDNFNDFNELDQYINGYFDEPEHYSLKLREYFDYSTRPQSAVSACNDDDANDDVVVQKAATFASSTSMIVSSDQQPQYARDDPAQFKILCKKLYDEIYNLLLNQKVPDNEVIACNALLGYVSCEYKKIYQLRENKQELYALIINDPDLRELAKKTYLTNNRWHFALTYILSQLWQVFYFDKVSKHSALMPCLRTKIGLMEMASNLANFITDSMEKNKEINSAGLESRILGLLDRSSYSNTSQVFMPAASSDRHVDTTDSTKLVLQA